MEKKYYYGIDFIKGLLILLVILGHVLQGSLQESLPRYIIYSFHMPLFVGISGFLINSNKIQHLTFKELFLKYFNRIIIPWIIAVIAYDFLLNINNFSFNVLLLGFIKGIIYPYYHLWFILGFLSYIILYYLMVRLKTSIRMIICISLIISICFYIVNKLSLPDNFMGSILKVINHDFRLYFFIFFVFGIYLNQINQSFQANKWMKISILVLIFCMIMPFHKSSSILSLIFFFCSNLILLQYVNMLIIKDKLPHQKFIEWIGRNSLPFYLWHVIAILLAKSFIGMSSLGKFYFVNIILFLLYSCIIYSLSKIKIINKYFFGKYRH